MTPGRCALSHCRLPMSLLMSALFPTFGKPTTATRTGRALSPLSTRLALSSPLTASGQGRGWGRGERTRTRIERGCRCGEVVETEMERCDSCAMSHVKQP